MNEDAAPASRAARRGPAGVDLDFSELYEEYFAFVWRTLRRYGVPDGALDDAAQDVFVVVHHQLAAFEGRSTVRTWLFGIARRVARNHRPNGRSFAMDAEHLEIAGGKAQGAQGRPGASVEAAEMLRYLLDKLASDKRDAFILMELEQMTIAEAADALGVNRNTMYSRLRAARQELEQAVTRLTLQERAALQGATGTATGNESTPPDQERSTPWKS